MDSNCQAIISRHIGYVPAIIIPDKNIEMTKRRFLLPENESFGFCLASIRKHIKLKPNEAIFFLIQNRILDMKLNVGEFYKQYKIGREPDTAFLYIEILKENTFGTKKERIYRNVPWIRKLMEEACITPCDLFVK